MHAVHSDPGGTIVHAELSFDNGMVVLASKGGAEAAVAVGHGLAPFGTDRPTLN